MSENYLNNIELGKDYPNWNNEIGLMSWGRGKAKIPNSEHKYNSMLGKCQIGTSIASLDTILCSSSYYDLWSTAPVNSIVGPFRPRSRGWKLTSNVDRLKVEFDKADKLYADQMSSEGIKSRMKKQISKTYDISMKNVSDDIVSNITFKRRKHQTIDMSQFDPMPETYDLSQHASLVEVANANGCVIFPGSNYYRYEKNGREHYRLMDTHDSKFYPLAEQTDDQGKTWSELLEFSIPFDKPVKSEWRFYPATENYILARLRNTLKKESALGRYLVKLEWIYWYEGKTKFESSNTPEMIEIESEFDTATSGFMSPKYYSSTGIKHDPTAWDWWKIGLKKIAPEQAESIVDSLSGPRKSRAGTAIQLSKSSGTAIEPRYQGTFELVCVPKDDDTLDEGGIFGREGDEFDSQHFFEIQQVITNIMADDKITFGHFLQYPINMVKIQNLSDAGLKYDSSRHFAGPANYEQFSGKNKITFRQYEDDGKGGQLSYASLKIVEDLGEFFTGGLYPYKYNKKVGNSSVYAVRDLNEAALANKFDFPRNRHTGTISNGRGLFNMIREHIIDNNFELTDTMSEFQVMFNPDIQTNTYLITQRYFNFLGANGETGNVNLARLNKLTSSMGDIVADVTGGAINSVKEFFDSQGEKAREELLKRHLRKHGFYSELSKGARIGGI